MTTARSRAPLAAWLVAPLALALVLITAGAARAGSVILLKSSTLAPYQAAAAGFRDAYRGEVVESSLEDADAAALERRIAALRPDAVVAVGLKATLFARDRFPRTPLVYCVVQNDERYELSGGWITGVSTDVAPGSEVEALRGALPDAQRIGLIYGRATGAALAKAAREACEAAHLTLVEAPVSSLSELPAQARDLAGRVDALWMPADPTVATPEAFRFLLELSLEQRKPLLVFSESLVRAGALMAVSPDYAWVGARAAEEVRRIQTGERAGDIPVAPLRRTRVILNASAAHALGRDLPAAALRDAEVLN